LADNEYALSSNWGARSARRYRNRPKGLEAALQHIEEAKKLTAELGGTDQDVKNYFFSLPPHRLRLVLEEYERQYGRAKREYAEETISKWRSRRVQMSGVVASRLYSLLPKFMALSEKFDLTQSLWKHICPVTRKIVKVGTNCEINEIVLVLQNEVSKTVRSYFVEGNLVSRFQWLAAGDVNVYQQLFNQLLELEMKQAVKALYTQLPVLFNHMRIHGGVTTHMQQTVEIGKHRFDIVVREGGTDISVEDPQSSPEIRLRGPHTARNWIWWLVTIAILIGLLSLI
jgi:hypothetical protein